MGQQSQIIYVEGKGFIPIQSGQTVQDAIAAAGAGASEKAGVGDLSLDAGGNKFGVSLPPMPEGDATNALKAIPQIGGLIAQFTPMGKMGMTASAALPALIELIRQKVSGEEIDPIDIGVQGAFGGAAKLAGNAVHSVGRMGEDKILKALNLGGDASDVAIETLPKRAIKEGARLTKESEAAIRAKGQATASGGLEELADAMGSARRADAVSPSRTTFWPQEAAANWLRKPARQMAMGQNMVKPLGLADTRETIAPGIEASLRALLAAISGQGGDEMPMDTSRGPRRRGQ